MKLNNIIKKLDLEIITAQNKQEEEITGGYTSDLLSDVIANSKKGNLWITLQIHQNIIAVATLKELAGIIIVNNRKPDEETIKKAKEENIPLLCSKDMAFEVSGKLYKLIYSEE